MQTSPAQSEPHIHILSSSRCIASYEHVVLVILFESVTVEDILAASTWTQSLLQRYPSGVAAFSLSRTLRPTEALRREAMRLSQITRGRMHWCACVVDSDAFVASVIRGILTAMSATWDRKQVIGAHRTVREAIAWQARRPAGLDEHTLLGVYNQILERMRDAPSE